MKKHENNSSVLIFCSTSLPWFIKTTNVSDNDIVNVYLLLWKILHIPHKYFIIYWNYSLFFFSIFLLNLVSQVLLFKVITGISWHRLSVDFLSAHLSIRCRMSWVLSKSNLNLKRITNNFILKVEVRNNKINFCMICQLCIYGE